MPVTEQVVEWGFSLLLVLHEPALFLLFVLKGAIIGKIFPTSVLLPGYLLAITASTTQVVTGIIVASFGYVVGQVIIYWLSSNHGIGAVDSLPAVSVSNEQVRRAENLFHRYSGIGIFITNLVPFVGTFIMIPAGMASYSLTRTVFYALSSTLLNYALIVLIAFESLEFLGLV